MSITFGPLGLVIIALALVAPLVLRVRLVDVVFFLSPFLDVRVLSIGETHISPPIVAGALLIGSAVLRTLTVRGGMRVGQCAECRWLGAFMVTVVLSLFMPLLFEGKINVVTMSTSYLNYSEVTRLRFSMANTTQVLFPAFMVLLFFAARGTLSRTGDVPRALVAFTWGTMVMAISGLAIQFSLYLGGPAVVESIAYVMHGVADATDVLARIQDYNTFSGFPRMYSFAGEPGFTANVLSTAIALILPFQLISHSEERWRLYHRKGVAFLLFACLLLTGSTAAYLGAVLLLVMTVVTLWRKSAAMAKLLVAAVVLLAAVTVFTLATDFSLLDYVAAFHLTKLTERSGSGDIRFETALSGWEIFTTAPFLGVGYGSHRTSVLTTSLLSNVGAVGSLCYVMFFVSLVYRARGRRVRLGSALDHRLAIGLSVAIMTWLPMSLVSSSAVAISFTWCWLMAAALSAVLATNVSAGSTSARAVVRGSASPVVHRAH